MKHTLVTLGFALFLASCTKKETVQPQPPIPNKITLEGAWKNENTTAIFCGGMLNWVSEVPYTPFPYVATCDTIKWVLDDSSKAPMYVYSISNDTLTLHSLTIGTPNKMTFTKCK